jgi:hypothetical protein
VPPAAQRGRMGLAKRLCDRVGTRGALLQVMNDNPAADVWGYSINRFARCKRLLASEGFSEAVAAVRAG